jgi:hypothetical protein
MKLGHDIRDGTPMRFVRCVDLVILISVEYLVLVRAGLTRGQRVTDQWVTIFERATWVNA